MSSENREKLANKPALISEELHKFYKGKIQITSKAVIRDLDDFSYWYTPGVAEPCKRIHKQPELVYKYTNKGNTIAIVSDGSRVLGLGDIGPAAGLPVMEGKALIFKFLGGVDAVPICINANNAEDIINFVKMIEPTYGGINLEDIAQPKCFEVLDRLREISNIPVWHDDQQGTALVTVAGLFNALYIVNKKIETIKIVLFGAGAANLAITRLLIQAGANPENMILLDSKGSLGKFRDDLEKKHPYKWKYAQITNKNNIDGDLETCLKGADVLIALSKPGPDTIKKEWIAGMAKDSIVFVCSNPTPEIWPWEAKEAGARIVATGRSDFPNQVNNSLGFPAIFRGVLDVGARSISDTMCIEAAKSLAEFARKKGIHEEYIVPKMTDYEVFPHEAATVGSQAIRENLALYKNFSYEDLYQLADKKIKLAQEQVHLFMEKGIIPQAPEINI